jgi:hypothetical protein
VPQLSTLCGPGTRSVNGRCELNPAACGAGTVRQAGQCVVPTQVPSFTTFSPWLVDGKRQAGPPRSSVRHSSVQGTPRAGSSALGLPVRGPENPSPQPGGPQRPLDALPVFSFILLSAGPIP